MMSFLESAQNLVSNVMHAAFKGLDATERRTFLSYLAPDSIIIGADTYAGTEYQGPQYLMDFALSCSLNGCVLENGRHEARLVAPGVCVVYGSYDIGLGEFESLGSEQPTPSLGLYGTGQGGRILYSATCVKETTGIRLAHLHYTPISDAKAVDSDKFLSGYITGGGDSPVSEDAPPSQVSGKNDFTSPESILDKLDSVNLYAYSRSDDFLFIYDRKKHVFSIDWDRFFLAYRLPPPQSRNPVVDVGEFMDYLKQFIDPGVLDSIRDVIGWKGNVFVPNDSIREIPELQLHRPDKTDIWVSLSIIPLSNRTGDVSKTLLHLRNIDLMKKREKALLTQVHQDSLTGLFNRRGIEERIAAILVSGSACDSVFLMLDIDNFKQLNDRYGHVFGDQFLISFSSKLQESIQHPEAILGRMGGDEFIIFYPHSVSEQELGSLSNRIAQVLGLLSPTDIPALKVTCSIGVAYARPGDDFDTLYRNADKALYVRKKNGKSGYSLYHE